MEFANIIAKSAINGGNTNHGSWPASKINTYLNDEENLEYAKEIALYGVLNNEASIDNNKKIGDSIDLAFLVLGKKLDIDTNDIKILETIFLILVLALRNQCL